MNENKQVTNTGGSPQQAQPASSQPAPVQSAVVTPAPQVSTPVSQPVQPQPQTQPQAQVQPNTQEKAKEGIRPGDEVSAVNVDPNSAPKVSVSGEVEIKVENETQNQGTEAPENTIERKKNNIALLILFALIILFVIFLPQIQSLFNADNFEYKYGGETSNTTSNLVNGFMKIGSETYIEVSDIRFLNPRLTGNNSIEVSYIPKKTISNVSSSNIYINIYNGKEELLVQIPFNPAGELEKDSTSKFNANISSDIYETAYFIKAEVVKQVVKPKETSILCKSTENEQNVSIFSVITYYFDDSGLKRYNVSRTLTYVGSEDTKLIVDTFKTRLEEEYNKVDLLVDDATFTNDKLKLDYTILLDNPDPTLELIHTKGETRQEVTNKQTSEGWNCN